MRQIAKYTFYVAQAIESLKEGVDSREWIKPIKELAKDPSILIFDPVDLEAQKTGTDCSKTGEYIHGLKKAGHRDQFDKVMSSIWWANSNPNCNRMRLLLRFREDFLVHGNTLEDLNSWGDFQAVCKSDFIFAYIEKNVKTVGTLFEICVAYLLNIPVFLILPDQTVTDANSTLIDAVRKSGGEIFYSSTEAVKYVKERYNIK